jgi:hypothetical protein
VKVRNKLEEISVEGMTKLKYIFNGIGSVGMHWTALAQETGNRRDLVMTVLWFVVPQNGGISWSAVELTASQNDCVTMK